MEPAVYNGTVLSSNTAAVGAGEGAAQPVLRPETAPALPGSDEADDVLLTASRSYQLEMYEESLRRNIIVAMDTGTGKTRVAILRIRAELDQSPLSKRVWFLAPTLLLCDQQFAAITTHIPGVQAKIFTSQSGVDAWSTQTIWEKALFNVRLVVATPQVLFEALVHGFVTMASIALIVFDEAHGCIKESPGSRIMNEFYHRAMQNGEPCPSILGLTASPVLGKKLDGLEKLEKTLDAVCIAPTRHRQELIAHANRPSCFRHLCGPWDGYTATGGPNLQQLLHIHNAKETAQLQPEQGFSVQIPNKAVEKDWEFMKMFCQRANKINEELGLWAAEYYVHKVVRLCTKKAKQAWGETGKHGLLSILERMQTVKPPDPREEQNQQVFLENLSSKVQKLADILSSYNGNNPTGIVFVREKPMAAVLARILSVHPRVKTRFRTAHVVGMSQMHEGVFKGALFLAPKDGRKPLQRFRTRQVNLLVATSVMEEGIDIPACNLVACIDELTNLKAYIQRRGRARDENSELHLLVGPETKNALSPDWESLEADMKRHYEDSLREIATVSTLEATASELSDELLPTLYVPATQARLSVRDAKQHLSHFCATMSSAAYADLRPAYFVHTDAASGRLAADVRLPITLPLHLRRFSSTYLWRTEADACADVAHQAYRGFFEAGLLSDNLLPPRPADDLLDARKIEGRPNVVAIQEPYHALADLAQDWAALASSHNAAVSAPGNGGGSQEAVFSHRIRIVNSVGSELCDADLVLPRALPAAIPPFSLYLTPQSSRPWTVDISAAQRVPVGTQPGEYDGTDHSGVLLKAAFGHRWPITDSHRLVRVVCRDEQLTDATALGRRPFSPDLFTDMPQSASPHLTYLVRDSTGTPYIFQEYLTSKPQATQIKKPYKGYEEAPEDAAYVALRPWPKAMGILLKTKNVGNANVMDDNEIDKEDEVEDQEDEGLEKEEGEGNDEGSCQCDADDAGDIAMQDITSSNVVDVPSRRSYPRVLLAADCTVDKLPMAYVQLGALLPSLTHVVETHLVAAELLATTPLGQLPIQDKSLITTAISTSGAQLPTNYEYLEFIGDSMLKVCATVNCAAQNLYAPEGHLSLYKDRLVANARLCRAAINFGLDRFIVSRMGSLKQWRSRCEEVAVLDTSSQKAVTAAQMSTKVLADVVEALIGAFRFDGGDAVALDCIRLLLPDAQWMRLEEGRAILYAEAPDVSPWQPPAALEALLGYTFTKKSLLAEALTHASTPPDEQQGGCLERLEFIGDALLDHIIAQRLLRVQDPPLTHQRMHLLRTTLGNASFLGFAAMTFSVKEPATVMSADGGSQPAVHETPLWAFLKHGASREMGQAQRATAARFAALREPLLKAFWTGHEYPWALLGQLHAEKFYSDVVESVLGAVWVDSGSLTPVEALLERMGILPYLQRAVDENIHLLHPKEELGMLTGTCKIRYQATNTNMAAAGGTKNPIAQAGHGSDEYSDEDDDNDTEMEDRSMASEGHGHAAVYGCRLFIDDTCVAEVHDGISTEDAQTQAADHAVKLWKSLRM